MKKLYFLLAAFIIVCNANAQIINIPDANFKAKLLQASPSNTIAQISLWPPVNGNYTKIDTNNNGEIEVSEAAVIYTLNVSNSNISSLQGIEYFTGLASVDCSYNQLTNLTLGAAGSVELGQLEVHCNNNQLTSINHIGFIGPLFLYCENNYLTSLDFSDFSNGNGLLLTCQNNPITNLVFGTELVYLNCSNTLLTTLDISGNYGCEMLSCTNIPTLTALMIKDAVDIDADMGDMWGSFDFSNNPNLQYLCVSENRLNQAQNRLNQYGYTNCALNSYCDFNPGSPFYTIQGSNKLDLNGNGCDASDGSYPYLRLAITNGNVSGTIPTGNGNYSVSVLAGTHTISPIIENSSYFTTTPSSFTVNFPSQASPFTQNFCIAANGTHNDLEITIIPLTVARPGFDASYKIVYKNKGTTVQSGSVNLAFNDNVLDFVYANPTIASQSANTLTWNFTNLQPFETRFVTLTLNLNSPLETPPLNAGSILTYTATVVGAADETPNDNTSALNQTVVNSLDPNDKTCSEGSIISPTMVGQYVHYVIRFENTGTANAVNIVVKDIIDTTKFDMSSLVPLHSSHSFVTRFLSTNKVEFIFENINLPFDDANNDGYVAFKIKTKPTLVVGNSFSNSANIYFDYNFPIVTNTATTTIQTLSNSDFDFDAIFSLSPVPTKNRLTITAKQTVEISSVSIYNSLGQLVQVETHPNESIDVSDLKTGNYFIKIYTDKGFATSKFIKE